MLKAMFDLIGCSPLGFSQALQSKKKRGEGDADFETRAWRERLHVNAEGHVFIPAMALKNCLVDCSMYLGEKIPGKGTASYTKHIKGGVMPEGDMVVHDPKWQPIKGDVVEGIDLFVPSNGRRGGGTRVWKTFPVIPEWRVHGGLFILDPQLGALPKKGETHKIQEYVEHGGQFIGMLFFRPINNGYYGRWNVENFKIFEADS